MERGLNPVEATEVAMEAVQGLVVAIAFVLSAVFIPIAFLGGMTGILYRQFALTIAVSMGLSAFVALTLTPALCGIILKPHEHGKKNFLSKFFDDFNNWFERTKNSYVGIVAKVISGTKLAVVFMLIVCGLTGLLFKILPSTFVMGFNPPALPGLGQVGGLTMQLIDLESHPDNELSDITDKIGKAANAHPNFKA